jgi:hypothetical protein
VAVGICQTANHKRQNNYRIITPVDRIHLFLNGRKKIDQMDEDPESP